MRISLRAKITLFVTLAILVISLVSTYLFVSQHKRHIENEFIARGTTLSYLLSKIVKEGLETEKLDLIEKAAFIIQAENVTNVNVYTDLWDLIESYPENPANKDLSLEDAIRHFSGNRAVKSSGTSGNSFYIKKHSGYYCFFHEVTLQPYEKAAPITIGYVMVDLSTSRMQKAIDSMIKSNIIAALFLTITAVLALNILIARIISKPIRELHGSVRKFKEGTSSEIETSRASDEIGDLAREFNKMSRAIKEKETMRKKAEEKLRLAAKVMESTLEGIFITDTNFNISAVNPSFTDITGLSSGEITGKKPTLMAAGTYDIETYRHICNAIQDGGLWQGEVRNRRKNGEAYTAWLNINSIKDNNGGIISYVGVFTDITQRKIVEEHLKHLATSDILTGLPNKMYFNELLKHSLEQAKRDKKKLALMFLDLDHFKSINDSFGHDIGDILLNEVAQRLKECIRQSDTISRLSGDEFAISLEQITDISNAVLIAQKILAAFSHPFYPNGNECRIGVSIGICLYPEDGSNAETLFKNADTAMYLAKNSGKNTYRLFSEKTDI